MEHSANYDTPSENWEIKTKSFNAEKDMLHTVPKMVNGIKGTLHALAEMEGGARQIGESSRSKDSSVRPRGSLTFCLWACMPVYPKLSSRQQVEPTSFGD
uniref:Uncharacterized protein n=1 Tax=Parascaris univalens TaxID=6257 RepID=A0A915BEN0_PARUN